VSDISGSCRDKKSAKLKTDFNFTAGRIVQGGS
jgi:hypothetical protein